MTMLDKIDDVFGDSPVGGIAERVLGRIDRYASYDFTGEYDFVDSDYGAYDKLEEIYDAMGDELIWDDDLYDIIKFYQKPQNVNFDKAMDCFAEDLLSIVQEF